MAHTGLKRLNKSSNINNARVDICLEEEEEEEEEEDDNDDDDDEDCGLVERSVSMYKSCSRRTDVVTDTAKRRKAQWRSNEKKKKKKKKIKK